jgi:hypothetical protein
MFNHTSLSLVSHSRCNFVPTLPIYPLPVPFPTHFCPESFPLRIHCESTAKPLVSSRKTNNILALILYPTDVNPVAEAPNPSFYPNSLFLLLPNALSIEAEEEM